MATTTIATTGAPTGLLLRRWRQHRRLSQQRLALEAGLSARHLSFVENGRSTPSRELILRLCEVLDVPARDRNEVLLATGLAPAYTESALDSSALAPALSAVRELLAAHEPFPALVVDRTWDVVETNDAVGLLLDGVAGHLLEPPVNALRLTLHPDGLGRRILDLPRWRTAVLGALRRSAEALGDVDMLALHDELLALPGGEVPDYELAGAVHVPLRLRGTGGASPGAGAEMSFLSMIATFGTAVDITLGELTIETFLPADAQTAEICRRAAEDRRR